MARIARPGIESGERLGRHRWKIEWLIAWLFGYRRLTVRCERKGSHSLAFLFGQARVVSEACLDRYGRVSPGVSSIWVPAFGARVMLKVMLEEKCWPWTTFSALPLTMLCTLPPDGV